MWLQHKYSCDQSVLVNYVWKKFIDETEWNAEMKILYFIIRNVVTYYRSNKKVNDADIQKVLVAYSR